MDAGNTLHFAVNMQIRNMSELISFPLYRIFQLAQLTRVANLHNVIILTCLYVCV